MEQIVQQSKKAFTIKNPEGNTYPVEVELAPGGAAFEIEPGRSFSLHIPETAFFGPIDISG